MTANPLHHPALVGNDIIRVRQEMGLTAEVFAHALGVARMTLYRWEADGCATRPLGPAPYLLQWIIDQSPAVRLELRALIKRCMQKDPERCAIQLYARMARTRRGALLAE